MSAVWYPGGEVPRKYWGVDPDEWPAGQRELDEIGPVMALSRYEDDYKRWGVAIYHPERPGRFQVVRHADRHRAEAISRGSNWVEVEWAHSGRRGKGHVEPLVATTDFKKWTFVATGWDVPL